MFGFKIKEWHSNIQELGTKLKSKKILGVLYDTEYDQLRIKVEPLKRKELTKRRILSRIAEIWDPIGINAGVCLTGKLLFQSITRLNYAWDQQIENEDIMRMWEKWNIELDNCKDVLIPRSILQSEQFKDDCLKYEIMGFVMAMMWVMVV